jgi:hypothetical protein
MPTMTGIEAFLEVLAGAGVRSKSHNRDDSGFIGWMLGGGAESQAARKGPSAPGPWPRRLPQLTLVKKGWFPDRE